MAKTIYFAHSRQQYRTNEEKRLVRFIRLEFPNYKVFNPGSKQNQRDFNRVLTPGMSVSEHMLPFFAVIDTCDSLVFMTLPGNVIGKGTYEEIMYAFTKELPVYCVKLPNLCKQITRDKVVKLHEGSGKKGWSVNYAKVYEVDV